MIGRCVFRKSEGETKLTRITALDPPAVFPLGARVNEKDAEMVDFILTDAWFYSNPQNSGTLNFWPNSPSRKSKSSSEGSEWLLIWWSPYMITFNYQSTQDEEKSKIDDRFHFRCAHTWPSLETLGGNCATKWAARIPVGVCENLERFQKRTYWQFGNRSDGNRLPYEVVFVFWFSSQ